MEQIRTEESKNFIEELVEQDMKDNPVVRTRFPPEPNGYIHIGHAKALFVDFGIARRYGGKCNLRFDDTNPAKEDVEYVEAIEEDIRWLGFEWDKLRFGSQYFDTCYELAVKLIKRARHTYATFPRMKCANTAARLPNQERTAPTGTGAWKRTLSCSSA